jgi:hypothetical protein
MGLWSEGAAAGLLDYLIQGICMRGARKIKWSSENERAGYKNNEHEIWGRDIK